MSEIAGENVLPDFEILGTHPAVTDMVPGLLYRELMMKHEHLLVQYGMLRASGGRLYETRKEAQQQAAQAEQDPDIVKAAQELLDQLKAQPGGEQHVQQIASGNYIAQASHGGTASVNVNQPKEKR